MRQFLKSWMKITKDYEFVQSAAIAFVYSVEELWVSHIPLAHTRQWIANGIVLQYHGTKSRCVFSQASSIVDKYVNGDDVEKAALELRYGKTNLKRMVEMYLEEQANAAWIKQNTTNCPDCQLDIERSMGW